MKMSDYIVHDMKILEGWSPATDFSAIIVFLLGGVGEIVVIRLSLTFTSVYRLWEYCRVSRDLT